MSGRSPCPRQGRRFAPRREARLTALTRTVVGQSLGTRSTLGADRAGPDAELARRAVAKRLVRILVVIVLEPLETAQHGLGIAASDSPPRNYA